MKDKKSIIIYFSRADENYFAGEMKKKKKGNTEILAEYIKEITNADMFKVEPLNPYSTKYYECIDEAKERTKTHNAPIKENVPDISSYEVIYVGSPIYWGGMPEELFTALKGLDYSGKVIRPFVTHEGSGFGSSQKDLAKLCEGADIKNGLSIPGANVYDAKETVKSWIED